MHVCREGIFVRVLGHIRTFSQQRSVVGFLIQPLKDFNEITYHMVHVVHSQLALQKGAPVVRGGEEREGRVRDENGGEGGKGRGREEMQTGRLKEWECRRVAARGGGKLTREWVPTCLFRQMLSANAVLSLLLISLPPCSQSSSVIQQ